MLVHPKYAFDSLRRAISLQIQIQLFLYKLKILQMQICIWIEFNGVLQDKNKVKYLQLM